VCRCRHLRRSRIIQTWSKNHSLFAIASLFPSKPEIMPNRLFKTIDRYTTPSPALRLNPLQPFTSERSTTQSVTSTRVASNRSDHVLPPSVTTTTTTSTNVARIKGNDLGMRVCVAAIGPRCDSRSNDCPRSDARPRKDARLDQDARPRTDRPPIRPIASRHADPLPKPVLCVHRVAASNSVPAV
jgi:hypothetical protein